MRSPKQIIPLSIILSAFVLSACVSTSNSHGPSDSGPTTLRNDKHVSESISVANIRFPQQTGGIVWANLNNYAQDGGSGGFGASYRNGEIKIDIFLYEAGNNEWKALPLSERLSLDVETFGTTLKEVEKNGMYSKVNLGRLEQTIIGGLYFSHIPFSFVEKAGLRTSHYYISEYGDRLLKVRITAFTEIPDEKVVMLVNGLVESFLSLNANPQ